MRKVDSVLYKEITAPALIALLILTFVVFAREFSRRAEILILKDASTLTVLEVILSLLPSILIFTVPLSFLIGSLIGFSRLSSDSEIVAMQAGGISPLKMLQPALKIGMGVTLIALLLTLFVLPAANWNLRQIRHEIGLQPVRSQIRPRVFNENLPDKILYVEDVQPATGYWKGVFLADIPTSGERRIILSKEGQVLVTPDSKTLQLNFRGGSIYTFSKQSAEESSLTRFRIQDVAVRFPEMGAVRSGPKKAEDKGVGELLADLKKGSSETQRKSWVELQARLALPLSTLLFAVLGVTLGIRAHRGGRPHGFVLSMVIAFGYYTLFASGMELASNGVLPPFWGVWGTNILLALGTLLSLHSSTSIPRPLHIFGHNSLWVRLLGRMRNAIKGIGQLFFGLLARLHRPAAIPRPGFRMARIIDLYILRSFLFFLVLTLAICGSLFYLFTFLELVSDIFANRISSAIVFDYFLYLLPHILTLIVPMSILIATLVTFGILDKTHQVVAFKSCGISLYRIFVPVFALSLLVSAFLYVMQEQILPYSYQRQDNLRNVIKGRPIQTFYQPGRKWIFGEGNRLYTYSYYDSERGIFAELSIFDLDVSQSRFFQHIYAPKASWQASTREWRLSNGWVRSLEQKGAGFTTFDRRDIALPEGPDYFVKEVKESSQMTYSELRAYILDLQKGGFEVDHLKTELHTKIALPVVNIIMAILGVPFAFSMGRRGALYGIAIGVTTGIVYWGAFGFFETLGVYGMLSPLLAAWGPNVLFGSGGLLLLATMRT